MAKCPKSNLIKPLINSRSLDPDEAFILKTTLVYLDRHITAFPDNPLEDGFWSLFADCLKPELEGIIREALESVLGKGKQELQAILPDGIPLENRFQYIISGLVEKDGRRFEAKVKTVLAGSLRKAIDSITKSGPSDLEKSLDQIARLFNLSGDEKVFALFLYLTYLNRKLHSFFFDDLKSQRPTGRKYLANAIAISRDQYKAVISGTLGKIEFFTREAESLEFNQDFLFLFEDSVKKPCLERFFKKVSAKPIPLDYHKGFQDEIDHVIALLRKKHENPAHILLYGPAGSGKSSFAQGILKAVGGPGYQIAMDNENSSQRRRAGIIACLNMTNNGPKGSIILVDEADNILNTRYSWFYRGETQDKAWLNDLLEEPGVRMIWITNTIDEIEPSVLRRFAFSRKFTGFKRHQRLLLWENIIKSAKAERLLARTDIESLAGDYDLSPAGIDLAVRKAVELGGESEEAFRKALDLSLKAHQRLMNNGEATRNRKHLDQDYFLEGLNVSGDLKSLINRLQAFSTAIDRGDKTAQNLSLLFHGEPGIGKTEFGRYLGECLKLEIHYKRGSDLLNPYLGVTEAGIRDAFQAAERNQAILMIDEVDTFLYSRELAWHSWEISQPNEFLAAMEEFRGILISTTNRLKALDQACLRRFHYKLQFRSLTGEGKLAFYQRLLAPLVHATMPFDLESQGRLMAIPRLAPGDFRAVREGLRFSDREDLSHGVLIEALQEEGRIRELQKGWRMVGF